MSLADYNQFGEPSWEPERQERPKRAPKKAPIHVGTILQTCPHCGEKASVELFRNTRCLACQVADFLGPIH